jgi:hypothetical protein
MTDDFKPVSETPPPNPLPSYEEEEAALGEMAYSGEHHASQSEFGGVNGAEEFVEASPEAAVEALPEAKAPGEVFWARIRRALFGGTNRADDAGFIARVRGLDQAIEATPDTPGTYVLRGELYLRAKEYALAEADFRAAYELAVQQFERSDWGIMAQAMQDRALAGLRTAEKRLRTIDYPVSAINKDEQTNTQTR